MTGVKPNEFEPLRYRRIKPTSMIRTRIKSAKTVGARPSRPVGVLAAVGKQLCAAGSHTERSYGRDKDKPRGSKRFKIKHSPARHLLPCTLVPNYRSSAGRIKEGLTLDVDPKADRPYADYYRHNQLSSIPDSNARGTNEHLIQGNCHYVEKWRRTCEGQLIAKRRLKPRRKKPREKTTKMC